jgi:TrmH family RNA methyltransferase
LEQQVIPEEAFVCPELIEGSAAEAALSRLEQLNRSQQTQLFEVTPDIFAKLAYREDSGGLLLVIPYLEYTLSNLIVKISKGKKPAFLTIIEGAEKPGNLGAILRTVDAAGADGVILCSGETDSSTDLHNPNVIRASLGTVFTVPFVNERCDRVIDWLRENGVRIVASTPTAENPYTAVSMCDPVALVMGSEARGLSDEWLRAADDQVMIPMQGTADSLNLSVATALLLYEVVRQRADC